MKIFQNSPFVAQTVVSSILLGLTPTLVAAAEEEGAGGAFQSCSSSTLGGMFCVLQESTVAQVITFVMAACFVIGIYLFARALMQLMKVSDNQGGAPNALSGSLLTLAAGTFLVAMPSTLMMGLATAGFGGMWDFGIQDSVGAANGALGADSIMALAGNFALNAAGPLSTLVMGISVLLGIVLVGNAMVGLANLNNPQARQQTFGAIAAKFTVGIALVNIFLVMEVIGASFGLPSQDVSHFTGITLTAMSYATDAGSSALDSEARYLLIMQVAFLSLIPFGLIAFVRGLLILKDTADGGKQASLGSGLTHIVGGVALVNAQPVSCAVMATLMGGGGAFCA
ncbi:hypothetical protein [Salipiger sp. PrR003]|uniref:hypothetical protein n=1 Tax=Salipiger sp. PrR003 TaxID=2706776 RepID=UPI0013DBC815|nr:hypothetical protein [Salipiger sp. PrR003]NDV52866.1 hypothetical protein [Salipiger sp. PrR003]